MQECHGMAISRIMGAQLLTCTGLVWTYGAVMRAVTCTKESYYLEL
jgi:hypothetical protein